MDKERVEINSTREKADRQTLFDKLAGIMRDPELAVEIGGFIRGLAFPGMIEKGLITETQKEQLVIIMAETVKDSPRTATLKERQAAYQEWAEGYNKSYSKIKEKARREEDKVWARWRRNGFDKLRYRH